MTLAEMQARMLTRLSAAQSERSQRPDPPLQVASAITVPSSFSGASVAVKRWWAAHCVNRTKW